MPFPPQPPWRAGWPVSGRGPRCTLCSCAQLRVQTMWATQFWGSVYRVHIRIWMQLQGTLGNSSPVVASDPLSPLPFKAGLSPQCPRPQVHERQSEVPSHWLPWGPGTSWHLANVVSPTLSDGGRDPSLTPFLEEKTEARRGWKLDKRGCLCLAFHEVWCLGQSLVHTKHSAPIPGRKGGKAGGRRE